MKLDRCQSCNAMVYWMKTKAGKSIPVDATSVDDGDELFDPKKHVSHFATCPDSKAWRKDKPEKKPKPEAAAEKKEPITTTFYFRDPDLTRRLVAFAKARGLHGTIRRDESNIRDVVTVTGFKNKTARTTFIGQWGTETCVDETRR